MNVDYVLYNVFAVFEEANIVLPKDGVITIYHHDGIENYKEVGAVFINVMNKEYCKSYVVMLPNQKYPWHYHKIKTESFYILYGKLNVGVNKKIVTLKPGEMLHVERGSDHAFWCDSERGVIFEEISTTYMKNDSVYLDNHIAQKPYNQRKTVIDRKEWKERLELWKKLNHSDCKILVNSK